MVGLKLDMASDASEQTKGTELSLKNELANSSSPYVSNLRALEGYAKPLTCSVTISC